MADVSDILVPNANYSGSINTALDAAISIPPETMQPGSGD